MIGMKALSEMHWKLLLEGVIQTGRKGSLMWGKV
jgi:hypothetical protein